MWGLSFSEIFSRGGPVMWPLLGFSILAVGVVLERSIILLLRARSYEPFVHQLDQRLHAQPAKIVCGGLRDQRAPLARVAACYLRNLHLPADLRQDLASQEASQQLSQLESRVHWLSVIGRLSPMIGLLGTVLGLVTAFQQIESLGGQVQPGNLASGIWQALLTTVAGLAIGLPALAAYHLLDQRIGLVALELQWLITHLNAHFATAGSDAAETPAESVGDLA